MKLAIVGSVGVPGQYGGFETLAENLVRYHETEARDIELTVYCSARAYPDRPDRYRSAALRYIGLDANGVQSIPYDIFSLLDAARRGHDVILLLGVSGALALPLLRLVSRAQIVTNIDGMEWRRDKWSGLARWVLKTSERLAVRHSHRVVADNAGIADHVRAAYGPEAEVIEYGGDHAVAPVDAPAADLPPLPDSYALALCRIEPENNVHVILEAFAEAGAPLVFVGNWDRSAYGRELVAAYGTRSNLTLLDPVYDPAALLAIRGGASSYVHGHSAGGTNPSLVEMMHFGIPILAFDCTYNRYTTEESARFFADAPTLAGLVRTPDPDPERGAKLLAIARRRYTWARIGRRYFALFRAVTRGSAAAPQD